MQVSRSRRARIGRRGLKYFQEHRNGQEIAFSTETRGYDTRYRTVNRLIAAGILAATPSRDSGFCLWYPVLRDPERRDV